MSVELMHYDDHLLPEIGQVYWNKPDASWARIYSCIGRHEDSCLEFSQVVFRFQTSLVVRDHLFRYRHASMAAAGLRYNEVETFVLPDEATPEARAVLARAYDAALQAYHELRDEKVRREVARYLTPCGVQVTYCMAFNIRSLAKNVFPERLSKGAQPETRAVAQEMWRLVHAKNPALWGCIRGALGPELLF